MNQPGRLAGRMAGDDSDGVADVARPGIGSQRSRHGPALLVMSLLGFLVACGGEPPAAPPPVPAPSNGGVQAGQTARQSAAAIVWFDGDVEAAFEAAAVQDKPLFLYWGAVWCPPCQEIKHTVFNTSRFIGQSRLFVPVYLDGDTGAAQAWGEKFGVKGYPTMIVFSPDGSEVTRIPGGIDVQRYSDVLGLALRSLTPVSELLASAREDAARLRAEDFRLLAWYSWMQDANGLAEAAGAPVFQELARLAAPIDPAAGARLGMEAVRLAVTEDGDTRLSPALVATVREVLADEALSLACWDTIAYAATDVIGRIEPGAERDTISAAWARRALSLRHHESLTTAEQLGGWFPKLELNRDRVADSLDEATVAQIVSDIERADAATRSPYARLSVVNQMGHVLREAGLIDRAEKLLTDELARSAAPYYFMSSLAAIAETKAQPGRALEWRRKAYEASSGPATRLQWGANYVRALVRLAPDDKDAIAARSMALIDEVGSADALFSGRNFRVIRTLNRELQPWRASAGDALEAYDARLATLCSANLTGQSGLNCRELLGAMGGS